MRHARGKIVVRVAGLAAMALLVGFTGASWKRLRLALYAEEFLLGTWKVELGSAVVEPDVGEFLQATRSLLTRERGLAFRLEKEGKLFLWWSEPYTGENEPELRYSIEGDELVVPGIESEPARLRYSFASEDRLVLRWHGGLRSVEVSCDRVKD